MSHVRGRLSLKPVHCSNSISRSERLLSFLLSLVWKFFSSPCTDHDRADWAVRRAASHNATPVAGKRTQGQGRPETAPSRDLRGSRENVRAQVSCLRPFSEELGVVKSVRPGI